MVTRLPVIDVGLPKSGTTSVYDFFACGGLRTSHWQCGSAGFCGQCMHANLERGQPLLEGCGDYDVFAEINVTPQDNALHKVDTCYFPQVSSLPQLYEAAPNATWVLSLRPTANWVASVGAWPGDGSGNHLREKLRSCDLPGVTTADDVELAAFYDAHRDAVRAFAASKPSLTFVEVAVEDDGAATVMHAAFAAVPQSCWGQSNCHSSCELWSEVQLKKPKKLHQQEQLVIAEQLAAHGAARHPPMKANGGGASGALVASADDTAAAPTDDAAPTDWWFNRVAPQCAEWCGTHADSWGEKCLWTGGTCASCDECEHAWQKGAEEEVVVAAAWPPTPPPQPQQPPQQRQPRQQTSEQLMPQQQAQQATALPTPTATTVRVLGATETSCAVDNAPLVRGIAEACERAEASGGALELRVLLNLFDFDSDSSGGGGGAEEDGGSSSSGGDAADGRNATMVASCLDSGVAPLPSCVTLTFVRGYKLAFWQREVTPALVARGKHDVVWLFDNDMDAGGFDLREAARLLLASNASLAQPLVGVTSAAAAAAAAVARHGGAARRAASTAASAGRAAKGAKRRSKKHESPGAPSVAALEAPRAMSGEDFEQLTATNPLTPAGCAAQSVPFVEIQTPMATAAAWATVHDRILANLPSWLTLSSDHGVGVTWCPLLREEAGDVTGGACAVLATPIITVDLVTIGSVARKALSDADAKVAGYFHTLFPKFYKPSSHNSVSRGECVLMES